MTSFDWLDVKQLEYIKANIKSWFDDLESRYLNKERIKVISAATIERIDYLINNILPK